MYTGLVTVGNGGVARLNAGNYIFRAGFTTTGSGSVVLAGAGGVLLYNANASYPAAGGACGSLSLAGTGPMTLSASKTGSYAGMLVFHGRTCTNAVGITVRTGTPLSGTLYVPAATLPITAANSVTIASTMRARSHLRGRRPSIMTRLFCSLRRASSAATSLSPEPGNRSRMRSASFTMVACTASGSSLLYRESDIGMPQPAVASISQSYLESVGCGTSFRGVTTAPPRPARYLLRRQVEEGKAWSRWLSSSDQVVPPDCHPGLVR